MSGMANQEESNVSEEQQPAAETVTEAAPRPVRRAGASSETYSGLGRRKTSVARVTLQPGQGRWVVNGRTLEDYFPRAVLRQSLSQPLAVTDTQSRWDIRVNVNGGGLRGQADAVRLGIARALLQVDEDFRVRLRANELLTRDPREVERKKPGRPKARKRFQFSKR